MSGAIIYWSATAAQALIGLAMALYAIKLLIGPRAQDRIIAFEGVSNCAIMMMVIISIKAGHPHNLPAILILAILSFASSVAFAKFLMRGEVIE